MNSFFDSTIMSDVRHNQLNNILILELLGFGPVRLNDILVEYALTRLNFISSKMSSKRILYLKENFKFFKVGFLQHCAFLLLNGQH